MGWNTIKKLIINKMSNKNKKRYLNFAKFLCDYGLKPPLSVNEKTLKNSWIYQGTNLSKHKPESYLKQDKLIPNAFKNVLSYLNKNDPILEIGCNCGRALSYLYGLGFNNLAGIEISKKSIELFKKEYNDTYDHTNIIIGDVVEEIKKFPKNSFRLIYVRGVLMSIRNNSLLKDMCRVSDRYIITSEPEASMQGFPRDFKKIFHKYGFGEISFDWYITDKNNNIVYPQKIDYKNYLNKHIIRLFVKEEM